MLEMYNVNEAVSRMYSKCELCVRRPLGRAAAEGAVLAIYLKRTFGRGAARVSFSDFFKVQF